MLDIIKLALRIITDDFDSELTMLINACLEEMQGLGVVIATETDGTPTSLQVQTAIVAYCKWQFGNNDDSDKWEAIYHTKLAQLKTMTGHTDWGDVDG